MTTIYTTPSFWAGTAERAVKTCAQSLLAVLTLGTPLWGLDWAQALGIAATAAAYSILTSLADPTRTDTATTTAPPRHAAGGESEGPRPQAQ
jgi:hypothetical protein